LNKLYVRHLNVSYGWYEWSYDYEDIINSDKASLDIFWLKDESLEESDNLPEPDIIGLEIIEDLQDALEQFKLIVEDLGVDVL
jgi:type I restriction enzyme M protein